MAVVKERVGGSQRKSKLNTFTQGDHSVVLSWMTYAIPYFSFYWSFVYNKMVHCPN
jgi:hypothetical protein